MTEVYNRYKEYDKEYCWQYDIRQKNFFKDIADSKMSPEEIENLKVTNFEFEYIDKTDKESCQRVKRFIETHEYLGKLPNRPTHRFIARTKSRGEIGGVIIMAVPNTFSLLLGEDYKNREKLLSRGACISWAPKHLGSWLVMESVRWMAKNTDFCIFTAYSDPEAKELGTIYQACNWVYLGQGSGTITQYFDPEHPEYGWFSSRNFRHKSKYNRYARELGIKLKPEWWGKYTLKWVEMPEDVVISLKNAAKEYQARCIEREVASKHKYAYILGKDKRETKKLKKLFEARNPSLMGLEYPKERGK
jgi:hypothetical protein